MRLDWDLPSVGSDAYRIYRATRSDLLAGRNGGFCLQTVTANTATFTDDVPSGSIAYYLVAGVKDGVEGSRGLDETHNGQTSVYRQRKPGDVCP